MGKKTGDKISASSLEITKLVAKRERMKDQLNRFADFVSNINSRQMNELQIRTEKFEPLLEQFEEVQLEIEVLDPAEANSNDSNEFESQFYSLLASAKQIIADYRQSIDPNQGQVPNTNNSLIVNPYLMGGAKLPNLGLPKFRGDFEKWTQFFETFQTLVHNNPCLDDIQKFYYLLDCLEGDARKILDCLEITRDNYAVALELLEKRFQNKPVIIQKHIKALVDMPSINKESAYLLRNVNDSLEKHVRALRALGEPVDKWDRLLIFLIGRKLDLDTKKEWEEKTISTFKGDPKLSDFTEFLSNKCRILETVETNIIGRKTQFKPGFGSNVRGAHSATETNRANHLVSECKSHGCKRCRGRHNTLLHSDKQLGNKSGNETLGNNPTVNNQIKVQQGSHTGSEVSESRAENQLVVATSYSGPKRASQVILSTAVIYIKDSSNNLVKCRALLDSGSQMNFISHNLVKRLNLERNEINIPVSGVNQMLTDIKYQTHSTIKSRYNNFNANLSFLVLENITSDIPVRSFDASCLNIPPNLKLADPEFNVSAEIDILIGAGLFFEILCIGQIKLGKNQPLLQKSVFGWIIAGQLFESVINRKNATPQVSCHSMINQDIQDQLEKFWAIEELNYKQHYSKEETDCEQHFVNTVSRDNSGRFCVRLPTKDCLSSLGESLENATRRFHSIENKLSKNVKLKETYSSFIDEYISLGHMTKVEPYEIENSKTCYLPHHGVTNEGSITTKLRVVFDASAKTSSGLSLNDSLKVGPCIQDDLFDILVRFRQHNVVITADIAKMYRQVNVAEDQRDLQRILWRSNPNVELSHYRLNTVTYGTAPASFLATRCIQQIALDIKNMLPKISNVILKNFYVDDLILSVDPINEAIEIGKCISNELAQYCFPLRKWSSNQKEVLDSLCTDENEGLGYLITDSDCRKTLGVFWQAKADVLEYFVKTKSFNRGSVTKRFILSVTSQIFDPLGLVGPVTIRAKVLLQKLWQLQLGWDESIPIELYSSWVEFYNQLGALNEIRITRQLKLTDAVRFEVHGFCDASEGSYGACIYLRSLNSSGDISVRLVCAKSRVAPIKSISLPRLELCGAVVLAKLARKLLLALDIKIDNVFLWTDSTIVLSWLAGQPNKWKVFVANRVAEVQEITRDYQWGHVISSENPADIISRGAQPKHLKNQKLWWVGPEWLGQCQESWPRNSSLDIDSIPEQREVSLAFANVNVHCTLFERYSRLFKLTRIVALCFRFYNNLKVKRDERKRGNISVNEFDRALIVLIKVMQGQVFKSEINALSSSQQIPKQSSVISLDPFLDSDGLLRVGGRIRNSNEKYDVKFPIILPQKHPLTRLIILDQHHKHSHAGPQAILAALRQRYWPISGRTAVRSVLSKCVTCFKARPYNFQQKMGDLPKDRVTPNRPFLICGVDFAGPFKLKDGKLRNRAIVKGYMCLFICFTTKAVHIELAVDLSTNSFLNCLKRFVSRRGLCARIYSDNATNFVGANNEIKELIENLKQDNEFNQFCLQSRIDWQCIPPRSPHHGGLWESAIKSAKYLIVRIIGNHILTFEGLNTVLAQVEAVLNSRPLTPLSHDPKDLLSLTPGHFLIGDALTAIPQQNVAEQQSNRLNQYQLLQKLYQQFWLRWSSEYLVLMQERSKWRQSVENIKVGSMVILKEESPPLNWKLGRVVNLHPGPDNIVRVVTVQTSAGTLKRSVQKLCVLPIEP